MKITKIFVMMATMVIFGGSLRLFAIEPGDITYDDVIKNKVSHDDLNRLNRDDIDRLRAEATKGKGWLKRHMSERALNSKIVEAAQKEGVHVSRMKKLTSFFGNKRDLANTARSRF